eukprot:UN02848
MVVKTRTGAFECATYKNQKWAKDLFPLLSKTPLSAVFSALQPTSIALLRNLFPLLRQWIFDRVLEEQRHLHSVWAAENVPEIGRLVKLNAVSVGWFPIAADSYTLNDYQRNVFNADDGAARSAAGRTMWGDLIGAPNAT